MSFTFWAFLYILLVFFLTYSLDVERKKQFYLLLVLPVLIYIHSFVDVKTVVDLPNYSKSFQDVANINVFNPADIKHFLKFHKEEYGFICLLKVVRLITGDFHVFLCINSCLLLGLYSYLIIKYSYNIYISVLLLLLLAFDQSVFVLRQHLSIPILWLTIPYIKNRKIMPFLLMLSIAFLFHKSSLIWLAVYFMYGAKKPWIVLCSLGGCAIVLSLVFSNLTYFNELFSLGYSSYINGNKAGTSNLVGFFLGLFFLLSYSYVCQTELFADPQKKFCFIALFIGVTMSFVGTNIEILSRFTLVFRTSLLFVIPIVFYSIKNVDLKIVYLLSSLACYVYTNYFGTFSVYLQKTELFLVNPLQMFLFFMLASFTIYILFHYTKHQNTKI